jgi:GTPase Era involved in 16S rRNA processing
MNRINFINQLNDYNKIMNINNNNSAKYLTLVFSINNNLKINIQCTSNDKMESVIKHFLAKCCFTDNNSYIYIYNGKKINGNLENVISFNLPNGDIRNIIVIKKIDKCPDKYPRDYKDIVKDIKTK